VEEELGVVLLSVAAVEAQVRDVVALPLAFRA